MDLFTSYNIKLLRSLYENVNISRLKQIFNICEEKWAFNLNSRLNDRSIKYLLIAEAPPWSNPGQEINYFYSNFDGPWCSRIFKSFYPKQKKLLIPELMPLTN